MKSHREAVLSDHHYADIGAEYERSNKRFMRLMVPLEPPRKILDVGCGTGLNSSYFVRSGHSVFGVDVSPVAVGKYRARGFDGCVADIEQADLPIQGNSFDVVYASEVIEHCADTSAFLSRLWLPLKPGGLIFISTDNSSFWAYRLMMMLGHTLSETQHPGHVRFFSKRSLTGAITAAGFEIIRVCARHMYLILGKRIGDPIAPLLTALSFEKEPRYASKDHFWQISRFAEEASPFWSDCLILVARKPT